MREKLITVDCHISTEDVGALLRCAARRRESSLEIALALRTAAEYAELILLDGVSPENAEVVRRDLAEKSRILAGDFRQMAQKIMRESE